MKKVLLLGDGGGWIVDRIVHKMASGITDFEIDIDYYGKLDGGKLVEYSETHDLIHYGNWDIARHADYIKDLKCPMILSVRSHRYQEYVPIVAKDCGLTVHTITPLIQAEFPGSVMIPDGVFEEMLPTRPFTVGFAGQPSDYKGFGMIAQACSEVGVNFNPATGSIHPQQMAAWWDTIDLYVCASVAEGHSTPVMEAMAMNKPFITTRVGLPSTLGISEEHFIDRSVDGIKGGILRHYTRPKVLPEYNWANINQQFSNLYKSICG